MKTFVVFSTLLVAISSADSIFKPAYVPFPTSFFNETELGITHGQAAVKNQFPYQISLQRRGILSYSHLCGGSIISDLWVLTAAHCTVSFNPANLRVVAGALLLNNANGVQTRNIERIVNHPLYPGGNAVAPNDIALIRLASRLQWANNVRPINIPSQGLEVSGSGVLSGWGLTKANGGTPNHLQFAVLPVVAPNQCRAKLDQIVGSSDNPFSNTLNLCSGAVQGLESACSGDSGGPYAVNNKVVGVVSWGISPCGVVRGAPSVYAKVAAYSNWIAASTNGEVKPNQY